jgi:penicillin-binding protein 1A
VNKLPKNSSPTSKAVIPNPDAEKTTDPADLAGRETSVPRKRKILVAQVQPALEKVKAFAQPTFEKAKAFAQPTFEKAKALTSQTYHRLQPVATNVWYHVTPQPAHPNRWKWGVLAATSGVVFGSWLWFESTLPATRKALTFSRSGTITIKSIDGEVLQQIGDATRRKMTLAKAPKFIGDAFVAAEDRRFYQHGGVDLQGILRATFSNARSMGVVEGASTITQQLARIVYLNQERSVLRKVREIAIASKLDRELSKQQILEQYLNLVYLGSGAYGVADAAWVYFGKDVDKLTLPEAATIAGLAPAPSEYSPLVNPKYAVERRNLVLERMQEMGTLSAKEANQAIAAPLKLNPKQPERLQKAAPYFTSYILKELPNYIPKSVIEAGGLTIQTTLNSKWQQYAERAVTETVRYDGPAQGFSQAALVAIDPQTGAIRAMVGGYDYKESQFNRATQAQRQPGSSFKALLYAAAMATGISPHQGYQDNPIRVEGYSPQNANRKFGGWISLSDAVAQSVNIVAVKTLLDVGFQPVIKLSHEMGIQSKLKPTYSLALGTSEVNLLELTSAYGTLAAKGKQAKPYGINEIRGLGGQLLYRTKPKMKQVLDPGSAALTTWLLEGVVLGGTGQSANLGRPAAGKTGTSEEARDLLFVGYIPQLAAGVWLGNDNNDPTGGASTTAAYTWREFMRFASQGMPVEPFPDLPKLDGRKGSLKAQPIKPKSYEDLPIPQPTPDPNSQGYDPNQGSGYYDSGSSGNSGYYDSGSSGSSGYYDSGSSGSSYDSGSSGGGYDSGSSGSGYSGGGGGGYYSGSSGSGGSSSSDAPAPEPAADPAPEPPVDSGAETLEPDAGSAY